MATESPYPPLSIPEVDTWEFLFERKRPFQENKVIYLDPISSRSYTFQDVKQTAVAFGNALHEKWNWQSGDAIAWFSPNCVDSPALTFGTLWAGGVVSPANPAYSASELAFQLIDSGAKAIITQLSCLKVAFSAAKMAGVPRNRILLIGDEKDTLVPHFSAFIASASQSESKNRMVRAHSDLAFLVYSSGTTGLPKGVMLSHRNIISNILMIDVGQEELSASDTTIAVLPFYHIYGLQLLINHTIYAGLTAVILPRFELEAFCKTVQDHKVTIGYLVPPILLLLSKSPVVEKYNMSSMKICMSAAAPLPLPLVEAVWKRLQIPVKQAYGLSETSPATHIQKFADWRRKAGSVGHLMPNQSMKIVSESGDLLPLNSEGEILVKGPNIFTGYLNNPTATSNSVDKDGYFHTGDIGYQDEDGCLFITDRLKELIKYKGFQVPPAELEGLLVGHEKVADACVLGVYDADQATELPRAYIVKAECAKSIDDDILEEEILKWTDGKLAHHKKLRAGIRFINEVPKSAAGKILRRVLRDRMKAEEAANGGIRAKL